MQILVIYAWSVDVTGGRAGGRVNGWSISNSVHTKRVQKLYKYLNPRELLLYQKCYIPVCKVIFAAFRNNFTVIASRK